MKKMKKKKKNGEIVCFLNNQDKFALFLGNKMKIENSMSFHLIFISNVVATLTSLLIKDEFTRRSRVSKNLHTHMIKVTFNPCETFKMVTM
jgi:hypothetical protein